MAKFTTLLIQTASILRRDTTGFDVYGNELSVHPGSGDEVEEVPCRIYEKPGSEDDDQRETVTRVASVFFGPEVDLQAYDRVEIDGTIWEIVGSPRLLFDSAVAHHVEAELKEIIL